MTRLDEDTGRGIRDMDNLTPDERLRLERDGSGNKLMLHFASSLHEAVGLLKAVQPWVAHWRSDKADKALRDIDAFLAERREENDGN